MISQPFREVELLKKSESKIVKNKTTKAGDISFANWPTVLLVIGFMDYSITDKIR